MGSVKEAFEVVQSYYKSPARALKELKTIQKGIDQDLCQIKTCLEELRGISAQL